MASDMKTEALLIDARDAARRLGVSPRTLWQLTKDGEVACVRVRQRVLYDPADLTAFIRANRQGGGPRTAN